ncbi:uncharacterized protein N7477_000741 [Penicillium maclennaniae]|uniref:uncharacterized protein n=1 Tax=Penicillium maclennaniae TaxID=1343394 RepID=UPI0025417DA5|nr:uncharacterized protein N7477_000741 [Penicillium maclennaniae]KAJ5684396.1 hypothetical protein N7477_000741 [Penicillium maclennaniae]
MTPPPSPLTASTESSAVRLEFSAGHFSSDDAFFKFIVTAVESAQGPRNFVFTDVKPSWGESVFDRLDETITARKTWDPKTRIIQLITMPTLGHDSVQVWLGELRNEWLTSGQMSQAEYNAFRTRE